MKRILLGISTLLFTLLAGSANASILIDFEGVGSGAEVLDFYNGGTDSMGNSGINYGVHFSGGIVRHNQFGAYLSGDIFYRNSITMTFSPTPPAAGEIDHFNIGFLATRFDDAADGGNSWIYGDGLFDAVFIAGINNPYCLRSYTRQECIDMHYLTDYNTLTGYTFNGVGTANRIVFNTSGLDNIEFGSNGRPANRTVPEPASLALIALGLLGLMCSRKRLY